MTGPRPPEPTREILNIEEAAQLLGVSTKTFAKVLREGQIPGRKIGREWKFSKRALIDWVGAGVSANFLDSADDDSTDANPITGAPEAPQRRPPPARRGESEMSVEED